jgi:hypothetical protein
VEERTGDFIRVAFEEQGQMKSGFIHKDLLAARPPSVATLMAQANAAKGMGPDYKLMLLWRMVNLDPMRKDVRDRLLSAAWENRRYDLAVQAGLGKILGLPERPSEKATRELAEAWRPHRGSVAIFTWHCYNNPAL